MFGLEYRLVSRSGGRRPFAPWFDHAPKGRVFGLDVEGDGETGSAFLVLDAGGASAERMARDVASCPFPGAEVWRIGHVHGSPVIEARWREPFFPGVPSPMALARRVLGPEAVVSFTAARDEFRARCAVAQRERLDGVWRALLDVHERYRASTPIDLRLEILRFRELAPEGLDDAGALVQRRLFEFGGFGLGDTDAARRACAFPGATPTEMIAALT